MPCFSWLLHVVPPFSKQKSWCLPKRNHFCSKCSWLKRPKRSGLRVCQNNQNMSNWYFFNESSCLCDFMCIFTYIITRICSVAPRHQGRVVLRKRSATVVQVRLVHRHLVLFQSSHLWLFAKADLVLHQAGSSTGDLRLRPCDPWELDGIGGYENETGVSRVSMAIFRKGIGWEDPKRSG